MKAALSQAKQSLTVSVPKALPASSTRETLAPAVQAPASASDTGRMIGIVQAQFLPPRSMQPWPRTLS